MAVTVGLLVPGGDIPSGETGQAGKGSWSAGGGTLEAAPLEPGKQLPYITHT